MKKVLMIVHLFHSSPRITGLAKYLPEFGWEPLILTIPKGENPDAQTNATVIKVPYHDTLQDISILLKNLFWKRFFGIKPNQSIGRHIEKQFGLTSKQSFVDSFYNLYTAIIYYPDSVRSWRNYAVKAGSEIIEKNDIHAIISSSSPVTCHLVAKDLKEKYNVPWVADLRDLWTQNHNYNYGVLRKIVEQRLEIKTLSDSDILVTVSPDWTKKLKMLHKKELVYTITNGFDPDTLMRKESPLTSKFTITYTGQIYPEHQDPSKLFNALRDLISKRTINQDDVEIRFYGSESRLLLEDITKYNLSSIVKIYNKVPREVSFQKQRESQILLHLTWEGIEKAGYATKLFEYLAAQRPILATGLGNDLTQDLIDETNSGIYCSTVEDIKNALKEFYSEYKCKGKLTYQGELEKINKYSYRETTKKYVEILDNLANKKRY